MKESRSKNIIIGVLVIIIIILSGLVTYSYIFNNDGNNLNNGNDVNNEEVKNLSNEEALFVGKDLYDKATEIYETWVFFPYCGYNTKEIYEQESYNFDGYDGTFLKSQFKNLDELKEYLGQYLSQDIISVKVEGIMIVGYSGYLKNINTYVNYFVEDGVLYCRNVHGKGWITGYYDYNITIDTIEEARIVYNIKSRYILDKVFYDNNSSCSFENVDNCNESDFEYKDTKFVIEKNDSGNWIVTDYTLHE